MRGGSPLTCSWLELRVSRRLEAEKDAAAATRRRRVSLKMAVTIPQLFDVLQEDNPDDSDCLQECVQKLGKQREEVLSFVWSESVQ